MRFVIIAAAVVALSGCTKTVAEMSYSERQALAQEITQRCYDQGVEPGSSEMEACTQVEVQSEVARRDRQARVQDARRASSGPTMCQNFGGNVVCF